MSKGRFQQDASLTVATALPAAGATAHSNAIDLHEKYGYALEDIEYLLSIPATPNLADTKNITITVEDSADGVNFAAVPALATFVVTGAGGVGAAAASRRFRLPSDARRYLRVSAVVDAAGGGNTAVSFTLTPLF